MKRTRDTSEPASAGGHSPIPKIVLAPVRRVHMNISVEVLTEQTVGCQDAGCESRAALRVRRLDIHPPTELLLCAHHAQVTVAQLREHLRSAAESGYPVGLPAPPLLMAFPTAPPTSPQPLPTRQDLTGPRQPSKEADGSTEHKH